jgi:hypothetical protein
MRPRLEKGLIPVWCIVVWRCRQRRLYGDRATMEEEVVLIVVPSSVMSQWMNEFEAWGHFKGERDMLGELLILGSA